MSLRTAIATSVSVLGLLRAASPAPSQEAGPGEWLEKMTSAVQTTNYEGTVIRIQDGTVEALKVVHLISDGVIREKVVIQEGNGLEIIRNGNEVHCILPDRKSVLVAEWDDRSTLFSKLPSSDIRFGSEYDVSIVREERVAGRSAIVLAIRAHDDFRYGHRLWLDTETGFPLQTKLIDGSGEPIEQVKFADISLGQKIHVSAFRPTTNIDDFRWFAQAEQIVKKPIETPWMSNNLPPGFRLVSSQAEEKSGEESSSTHMMFSDGLASVSVFVEQNSGDAVARRSKVGASNSFSIPAGEFRITAVGEVPLAAAEQIARSMQLR